MTLHPNPRSEVAMDQSLSPASVIQFVASTTRLCAERRTQREMQKRHCAPKHGAAIRLKLGHGAAIRLIFGAQCRFCISRCVRRWNTVQPSVSNGVNAFVSNKQLSSAPLNQSPVSDCHYSSLVLIIHVCLCVCASICACANV